MEIPPDVVPLPEVHWEDEEEAALFASMVDEVRSYLESFSWCDGIRQLHVGLAVPGAVAVFFAEIVPQGERRDIEDWLWVVVGDLPPAYLVPDEPGSSTEALRRYIEEMREWVRAARAGGPVEDLIPVRVRPTTQSAEMLASRLDFLERHVIGS